MKIFGKIIARMLVKKTRDRLRYWSHWPTKAHLT